ncbi:MAG: hypothetical protein ACYC8T_04435, partial [Myxococcaceae bacterium]
RGVSGDGDFDGNAAVDWRDVGALASRLGTTPASATWPAYHWQLDLGATLGGNQLDEGDLALLLGRFGAHP